MTFGDIIYKASKMLLESKDAILQQRIIREAKQNASTRQAYIAFSSLPIAEAPNREIALHIIKESIKDIDKAEYKRFLKSFKGDFESNKVNESIHNLIVSSPSTKKHIDSLNFLVEYITQDEEIEDECNECNEEYDNLSEEDKNFLEGLVESDDDKKKLMFDELKGKALDMASNDIKEAKDGDEFEVVKEAYVKIAKMPLTEENIIELHKLLKSDGR